VTGTTRPRSDPDRLAELEEERRFLLRSLDDLEREHEAGDVDDHDYEELKDGYTARAASVIKAIDDGRAARAHQPTRWGRVAAGTAVVLAVAVGLGVLVANLAGQRFPGQTVTGGIAEDTNSRLAQARALLGTDPAQSLALYTEVLRVDPDNVEARTYSGWLLSVQAGQRGNKALVAQTEQLLDQAIAADPTRADAYCFKAVVRFRFLDDARGASAALDQCEARHPPGDVGALIASLRGDVDAALGDTASSSPTTTTP
jgi:cytochrome c-type biogenesis protein CcmH/NrfG